MPLPRKLYDFYKASPMREGILCWYPFKRDADVLDLSGGTLTALLCRQCEHVVSDTDNINGKFDYIVAIDPEDFSIDTLVRLKNKLNNHGRLLMAFENPFALRYWAGTRASETGLPYDSLFGRVDIPGKAELSIRLKQAGFDGQKWYYPLTDHWFAREVYSENYLPDEYLNQRFIPYVADDESLQFDERGLYREVIRGGAFEFMCGAYLIEARVCGCDEPCSVDYAAVTAYREPSKRFATIVCDNGTVLKSPLHSDSRKSVVKILHNHEELAALGVNVVSMELKGEALIMPRLKLPTLWDYWVQKLTNGTFDENEMFRQFDRIHDAIMNAAKSGKCFWELVPANCFYDAEKDELIFFDQEYYWEDTSPEVAIARAIYALKYSPAFLADKRTEVWLEQLKSRYDLIGRWDELEKLVAVKIHAKVFGEGAQALELETEQAEKRIAAVRRYRRFLPVVNRLSTLGFKRPSVYGYGLRGQALLKVLREHNIEVSAIIDEQLKLKHVEDIPSEVADVIIVSILDGGKIAEDLRGRVNIPVYTLEELIGE